jgi:hypothetical protein
VAGESLASHAMEVQVGNWDGEARVFYPSEGGGAVSPNAVRIVATREGVPLFFAGIWGETETAVTKAATATLSGGHCIGMWGIDDVTGHGGVVTDSYDSTAGAYGGANVHANGDLCSCGDITVNGSVTIYGDAMYGDGHDITINGGSHEIWGVVAENNCGITQPDVDMAGAQAVNDNDTIGLTDEGKDPFQGNTLNLKLVGTDNLTLAPGVYYFTSVSLTGSATITVTGPTEIYVSGSGKFMGNGILNTTGDPNNLIIYSTGSQLDIGGTNDFYGGIVAPETDVDYSGTGDFYGVAIGQTLDLGGDAVIHVDESLVKNLYGLDPVAPALVQ